MNYPLGFVDQDYYKSKYHPQNHPYVENETYTGRGCAICGKFEEDHKKETK